MSRLLCLIGSLLFAPTAAGAEDFTGFYAGVNAGYGQGHEETNGTVRALPSSSGGRIDGGDGVGLPPSASAVAATVHSTPANRKAGGH